MNLGIELCGVSLKNPLVLASGVWGSCAETLIRLGRAGAGAVTTKSCSLAPRAGHANPTVLSWPGGLINAVGLSNPGAEGECAIITEALAGLRPLGVPLIASVFESSPGAFAEVVAIIATAKPDIIELNISCPNVASEYGRPFALDPKAAGQVVSVVRDIYFGPLLVKLSPNTAELVQVAQAVVAAGADGITAVNTLGPGMLIDIDARRPILTNRVGGVSGMALRPIALRCVFELFGALNPLPIVGTGGVSCGADAVAMLMAGATAVGLGSALEGAGEAVFGQIVSEMRQWMVDNSIDDINELRGCAHE